MKAIQSRNPKRSSKSQTKTAQLPNTLEDLDRSILDVLQSIEEDFIRANDAVSSMIRDARPFVRSTVSAIDALEPLSDFLRTFADEPRGKFLAESLDPKADSVQYSAKINKSEAEASPIGDEG